MSAPPELPQSARVIVERARSVEVDPPLGARDRVWRKLAAKRSRRFPRFVLAGGLAFATASLVLFFFLRPPAEIAVVIRENGMRSALVAGEAMTPIAENTLVDLHSAGQLVAGPNTIARIDRIGHAGHQITLERGTLLIHVRPRTAGEPFMVKTRTFTARVIGTILRVTAGPDGGGLAVGHGTVEVTPNGAAPLRVAAGEHWPLLVVNVPTSDELARLGPTELEGVTAASFAPPPALAPTCEGTGRELVACRLAAARSLSGASGEAALYQVGELAWRTLDDRIYALAIWREARARFPKGALAQETDESIIDALVALRRSREASGAIEDYLVAHPTSARGRDALRARHAASRDRRRLSSRCRGARASAASTERGVGCPSARRAKSLRAHAMTLSRVAWLATLVLLGSCLRDTEPGSLGCMVADDCSPPASVCGADGRCVPGCVIDDSACAGGSTCDPQTGDCTGGIIGTSCLDDRGCDPPDIVCRPSTHTCVAGCTLASDCDDGQQCDTLTGHCCDAGSADCQILPPPTGGCASDSACMTSGEVCVNGACVTACTNGGTCTAPEVCQTSGHCAVATCAVDADCDATSACDAASACFVLPFSEPDPCPQGGRNVSYHCATEESAAGFVACTGGPGDGRCAYCLGGSCFYPGLCSGDGDCHHGETCTLGLCRGSEDQCPSTVPIGDVVAGHYGAGKQICVRGKVGSVRSGYDGMIEPKLDEAPYLFVDVPPMYHADGVMLPDVGDTVTAHGTVRWDAGHDDWELSPVDWIGP